MDNYLRTAEANGAAWATAARNAFDNDPMSKETAGQNEWEWDRYSGADAAAFGAPDSGPRHDIPVQLLRCLELGISRSLLTLQ